MTYSEIVTAAMALVALLISAVAMYRAGVANKIAKDANELARSQDALAQLHLQQEQDRRNKTNLDLVLAKYQSVGSNGRPLTSYKFQLTNKGDVPADSAGFEITTTDSPLMTQDYQAKLPARLAPGQSIGVLAAVHLGTPSKLDAVVFWTNPDGSQERQVRIITM